MGGGGLFLCVSCMRGVWLSVGVRDLAGGGVWFLHISCVNVWVG